MSINRHLRAAAVPARATLLILLAACGGTSGGTGPTTPATTVGSVLVTPATLTLDVGQTQQYAAQVVSVTGQPLAGRQVSWSSSDQNVASVSSTGLVTAVATGTATITAASEGRTGTAALTVQLVPVASVTIANGAGDLEAGTTRQLSATPRDGTGQVLNRPVSWESRNTAVATVSSSGLVSGVASGTVFIAATAGTRTDSVALTVTPRRSVATLDVHPQPVQLRVGGAVRIRPLLRDGSGALLPGRPISFSSANPAVATVGPDSVIRAVGVGTTTVTVTSEGVSRQVPVAVPTAGSEYNIELQFVGPTPAPDVRAGFEAAVASWRSIIIGDLGDVPFPSDAAPCSGNPVAGRTVDDLLIFVRIDSIDGPGRVLGSAGPCYARIGDNTAIAGIMNFDSVDVRGLILNGQFADVIRHEMGHVIGVGTLWQRANCLRNPTAGTARPDTHLSCDASRSAFLFQGGERYVGGDPVPVENCAEGVPASCGAGTANSHWREIVFGSELMTGYLNQAAINPMSILSIASLIDLGYTVNMGAAEPFTLPGTGGFTAPKAGPLLDLSDDILREPIRVVDPRGRVVFTLPPPADR